MMFAGGICMFARLPGWSRISAASAVVLLAGLTAACSSSSPASTANAGDVSAPVSGGTLNYAITYPIGSLDPAVSDLDDVAIIDRNIFDSLVVQTGADSFGPWLATRWTVSPDGKTYTFYLRSGVKFQDGTPFTAAAVKATLAHAVAPATKSQLAASLVAPYAGATVVNEHTISIRLSAPDNSFLQALASPYLGIQSAAELAKPASKYVPVGTGPYSFVAWNVGKNVILQRTAQYTSPPSNATHTGPGYLSKLVFDYIPEDATRYGALTSGQVQGIEEVPPIDMKALAANASFRAQQSPVPGLNYNIYLNSTSGPLTDPLVRTALAESINIPGLVKSIYLGFYQTAAGALGTPTPNYDKPAAGLITQYDPAAAEKLLDQAGWTHTDAAGFRTKDGQQLNILWPYLPLKNKEERDVVAQGIQAEAADVGINIERPTLDTGAYLADLAGGKMDMFDYAEERDSADVLSWAFDGSETLAAGGGNVFRVNNAQLNSWLSQATQTTSPSVEATDYADAQQYVLENHLVIPVYAPEYTLGETSGLHGVTFDPQADPLFYGAWLSS